MKYLLTIIASILFISSIDAQSQTKFITQKVGHVYYLNLPDYMIKTKDLNDAASLQYKNVIKEAYVIVIEDSKEELETLGVKFTNPMDFYKDFIQSFMQKINNPIAKDPYKLKVNGNSAVQGELTASIENEDIFYLITVVETKTHFYKIMCWTTLDNKKVHLEDFKKIASSLKD
ncbi:MAG: hypothetical protein WCT77_02460 [Bacteroidota bacterium]|jgi:hypothetical protein